MKAEKLNSKGRFIAGPFSVAVLLVCVAGALASFGPISLRPGYWASPFTWDAPTRTVARFKAIEKDTGYSASKPVVNSDGETIILDDWNYTAIVRGRPGPSHHH